MQTLPVIPIPNLVLFPNTAVPVLVTEPIYIELIEKCIHLNGPVVVSLSRPVTNVFGKLKFTPSDICTQGIPIIIERPEVGIIKIIIKGEKRVKLIRLEQNLPYLKFQVEDYKDQKQNPVPLGRGIQGSRRAEHLKKVLFNWVERNIEDGLEKENFLSELKDVQAIVDNICMFIIKDIEMRQIFLESQGLIDRIYLLNTLLEKEDANKENSYLLEIVKDFEIRNHSLLRSA